MTINIRDLMVINPNTIHPETPISQALTLMREVGCRHLPVIEHGILLGILSERDIRLTVTEPVLEMEEVGNKDVRNWVVAEIMATDLVTIKPNATIQEAAKLLNVNEIGALPVLADGVLVGIVTVYDILDFVAKMPDFATT